MKQEFRKKHLVILLLCAFLYECSYKEEPAIKDNTKIAMPHYFRKVTGYDSIQLIFGGRSRYNEAKKNYDVTWDSLCAEFCYPNKYQFEKFKKDTVYIHDTIYKKQYLSVKTLNQY